MLFPKNTAYSTLILASVAGFCDTVTFVAADELFSAHVTGNFIVFAYDLVSGAGANSWERLLTFPVFMIAVMIGGTISKALQPYVLILAEGLLLFAAGVLSTVAMEFYSPESNWLVLGIVLLIVIAMGLQNAFGRILPKETYGLTTMMTGNVTQVSLDLMALFSPGVKNPDAYISLRKQLPTIEGFLGGSILGAVGGKFWGLASVVVPGFVLIIMYYSVFKEKTITTPTH